MRGLRNILAIVALASPTLAPPAHAQTAQEIVAATDRIRNPGAPFRVTNTLTEYDQGAPRNRSVLTVFSKQAPDAKQFRNLVAYQQPARDQGKMVLMDNTQMWFYDPASKDSVRISPQQRLLGQAADGDVVTVNLSADYNATLLGSESLLDADHVNRDCWHLDLVAADDQAVYSRIEYWVEKGSNHPVKGKYYSDSGRLLKIVYDHKFALELGGERPIQIIIIDGVNPNLVTTMDFTDYRFQDIPESWFQRDFLPRLKPE